MEQRIKQNLIRLGVKQGHTLGVAVSGGVDSMTLLHCAGKLAEEMGVTVVCYHMEHGIRGDDSIDDMRFVYQTCSELGIRCIANNVNVPGVADETRTSIETAARNVRYAFLDAQDADFIATAHHAGDVAETVLMNLARGSGLSGLCGIPEKRGRYIRPMLKLSRREIEAYAQTHQIVYKHDVTNDDVQYTRNFIRHELIPNMTKVNAAAEANMVRASELLREDERALNAAARDADAIRETDEGVVINSSKMALHHVAVQRRIVRQAIGRGFGLKDIERVHVEAVLDLAHRGISARSVNLPGELVATAVYDKIVIGKMKRKRYNNALMALPVEGEFAFEDYSFEVSTYTQTPAFGAGAEYFNAETVYGAAVRHREENDYIVPLGMTGKKRLSDYLSDRKIPRAQRDELVVLAKGGEVFWVVGVGVSETSKIDDNSSVIKISFWER